MKPTSGRGAGCERSEPDQDDTEAGFLVLETRPEMDTSPGSRRPEPGKRSYPGTPREPTAAARTARAPEDTAARDVHLSIGITLSDEAAEEERARSRSARSGSGRVCLLIERRMSRSACPSSPVMPKIASMRGDGLAGRWPARRLPLGAPRILEMNSGVPMGEVVTTGRP